MTHGETVKLSILTTGLALWPECTARAIARSLNLSHSAVLYHFGSADELRSAVARHAVETGNSKVVAQLITSDHPAVASFSKTQRAHHLAAVG